MAKSGRSPKPFNYPPQYTREYISGNPARDRIIALEKLGLEPSAVGFIFGQLIELLPDPNANATEFPFAAGVFFKKLNGMLKVISTSTNRVNELNDSTAHAELLALREAEEITGSKHLDGHFLASTHELCVMCCGAAANTDVDGVIYGASHNDIRGHHSLVNGEYRPYRTSPPSFHAENFLADSGIVVVSGFLSEEVLAATTLSET